MWTFSKSTWKGQLKNVQDGIPRLLGSREIQKTKVSTVLLDTLYNQPTLVLFLNTSFILVFLETSYSHDLKVKVHRAK